MVGVIRRMSSSLLDLAIDLINDAKGSDSKNALYLLEQVKEIAIHRDRSILFEVYSSIIDDFMLRPSVPIRKFLVSFAAEAMAFDKESAYRHFLGLLYFLLDDESESLQILVTKEFMKYRSELIMLIASRSTAAATAAAAATTGESLSNDPKQHWQQLCAVTARLSDPLTAKGSSVQPPCSDRRAVQCLRLLEAVAVFGIPEELQTAAAAKADPRLAARSRDPRLRRGVKQPEPSAVAAMATAAAAAATAAAAAASLTADAVGAGAGGAATGNVNLKAEQIPLHHPFINRNELTAAAQDVYARMLQWAGSGGPEGAPFSAMVMVQLLHSLMSIASARQQHAIAVADALVRFIATGTSSGGDAVVAGGGEAQQKQMKDMAPDDRLNLARAVHRFLRAAAHAADPEGKLQKLRVSVTVLEAMTGVGQKRSLTAAGGAAAAAAATEVAAPPERGDEDDEDTSEAQSRRSSAIAAVNAAEARLQSLSKLAAAVGPASAAAGGKKAATAARKGAAGGKEHVVVAENTELSAELAPQAQQLVQAANMKLTNVVVSEKAANALSLQAIPQQEKDCAVLAEGTLCRLLEGYPVMEESGDAVGASIAQIALVLWMAIASVCRADVGMLVMIDCVLGDVML